MIKNLGENSRILRNTLIFFGGVGAIIFSIAVYRYIKRLRLFRETRRVRAELEEIVNTRANRSRNLQDEAPLSQRSTANPIFNEENESSSEDTSSVANVPRPDPLAVAAPTCIVCLSEQREVILMNCGHVCVCASCAMEIMQTRPLCPICRATIDRVAPAFIA